MKALLSCLSSEGAGAPGELLEGGLLIACGDGAVRLLRVQREGRAQSSPADFLNGFALPVGTILG